MKDKVMDVKQAVSYSSRMAIMYLSEVWDKPYPHGSASRNPEAGEKSWPFRPHSYT